MKNAIIVHGKPSLETYRHPANLDPSDSNWLPWMKRQLTLRGIFAVAPDMPEPFFPKYPLWKREFERHDVTAQTILIGHSAGAGFLLRWMSENPDVSVRKLALVAPWLDPNNKYGDFMDFKISGNLPERVAGRIAVFYSSQDDEQAIESVEMVAREIPQAHLINIPRYGHFMIGNAMKNPVFPELLDEIVSKK